jgi:hypothetical protein
MRQLAVFIAAIVGCSAPVAKRPPPPVPPRHVAQITPDASQPLPLPGPGVRGAACSPDHACADGLLCAPMPGGYCGSLCGVGAGACDGTCVETGRAGELCLKSCTRDADCRADEGYVCDPEWHACAVPNMAAIRPKQCPLVGAARDPAFGTSEAMSGTATPGAYQFEPSGVTTDQGSAVAMYITRGSMFEGNVLAVSRSAGGLDQPIVGTQVKGDKQSMFDPWLARDRAGTIYAVWYQFDGRDQNGAIVMATSADRGATWSDPAVVDDPADCADPEHGCFDKPMIAIGPGPLGRGEATYIFYSAEGGGLRVRGSMDHGKTLGKPATALAGIYGNAVVGSDGRLHVVALDGGPMGAYGSAQQKIEYTVSADGATSFAKPITISGRDEVLPFFFSNPSVAVDDARRWLYFAYVRGGRDAKWDLVLAATRDGGKTWIRQTIGDGCAIHMVPQLALDPTTGTLHVAYYDSVGAPGRFVHATCTIGLGRCMPWGAINSEPFAALSTERHGTKWIGEYETLAIDAKRRVLHAFWSQPVTEGDHVVSRIFHASAKLR